tara:strand:- start:1365 stop:1853 length:489 start_codon:yes stop_codon:yes gene_type:complete
MAIYKVDGVDGVNHFPKKFVRLHCTTATIAKGDWVMIDVADTTNGRGNSCKQTTSNVAGAEPAFGIATETLTAAGILKVQTAGLYGDGTTGGGAATGGSVTAGSVLAAGNTVGAGGAAGQVMNYAGATHVSAPPCGLALVADDDGDYGANETTVLIYDQGLF